MITHIIFDHDDTLYNTAHRDLFKGIQDLLRELKNQNIKLYLWTARSRASGIEILKSLGIITYFEDMCFGNDAFSKPDPRGVEGFFDCPKSEILMVGDSLNDIYSAKALGVKCVSALWAHNFKGAKEEVKKMGASFVITSPDELLEIIQKEI